MAEKRFTDAKEIGAQEVTELLKCYVFKATLSDGDTIQPPNGVVGEVNKCYQCDDGTEVTVTPDTLGVLTVDEGTAFSEVQCYVIVIG